MNEVEKSINDVMVFGERWSRIWRQQYKGLSNKTRVDGRRGVKIVQNCVGINIQADNKYLLGQVDMVFDYTFPGSD